MPRIDISKAPTGHGTAYPDEFAGPCLARRRWKLGDAVGLDQFGVNLLRLPAGAWSAVDDARAAAVGGAGKFLGNAARADVACAASWEAVEHLDLL